MEAFANEFNFLQAIKLAALLTMLPLGVSMCVGFLLSVLQAATQIQEQTLTFVPKLVSVGVIFVVAGEWMSKQLIEYCTSILNALPLLSL